MGKTFENNKKVSGKYLTVSVDIAQFAFKYNKTIENAFTVEGILTKMLCKILLYPSRFMLKYNAVKRVCELNTSILVYALASKIALGEEVIDQNRELKSAFSEHHTVGDVVILIFSLISIGISTPAVYYILVAIDQWLVNFGLEFGLLFDLKIFFIISLVTLVLVLAYNYIEYNRLRGKLKIEFDNIKKEIKSLS